MHTQPKISFQIKLRSQVNSRNDLPNESERIQNQENQKQYPSIPSIEKDL